jgi:hypothetical protein
MTTAVSPPVRRTGPATSPGRWMPHPRAATTLSTSDVPVPDTRRAYADVLLARLGETWGVPFASYAISTIVGEIKRYFRDAGWTVRAPRRLQELGPQLATAAEELAQALHRSPMHVSRLLTHSLARLRDGMQLHRFVSGDGG